MQLQTLTNQTQPILNEIAESQLALLYANISTEDGFVLSHAVGQKSTVESDKVSALASTLFSLAESSAKDISSDRLKVLIMESERSNSVVVRSSIRSYPVVLSVSMDNSVSLGHILYQANRIAEQLKTL